MTPFVAVPGALSPVDCDGVLTLARSAPMRDAAQGGGAGRHGSSHRADVAWLDDLPAGGAVMDRLISQVAQANRDGFGFDLTGFAESAQIARYGAEREGHFDWHCDIGEGALAARRKLTIVVQLSDPLAYAGGTLELRPDGAIHSAPLARGTATVFPAFVLQRVTPVISGERWSLTLWAHGPAFR